MPAARPSQSTIARALSAWQAAGLPVGRMIIRDGAVIIEALPEQAAAVQPSPSGGIRSCDQAFGVQRP